MRGEKYGSLFKNKAGWGITPACAGKRCPQTLTNFQKRDHPRLRGEKLFFLGVYDRFAGSPPLARGKAWAVLHRLHGKGITPACAGKRVHGRHRTASRKDHPRLRGEKRQLWQISKGHLGSPPLARGKVRM